MAMNDSFNYSFYKRQLSPFGQKVLNVLVEQWHADNSHKKKTFPQRTNIPQPSKTSRNSTRSSDRFDLFEPNVGQHSRKKCTLKFIEKETPTASTPLELWDSKIASEKEAETPETSTIPFELFQSKANTQKNGEICIAPTTSELLNTTSIIEQNHHGVIICTDDLTISAIESSKCDYFEDRDDLKTEDTIEKEARPTINLELSPSNINNVSWSNMFDTELFRDNHNNQCIQDSLITIDSELDVNIAEVPIDTFKKPNKLLSKRKNTTSTTSKPKKERRLTVSHTKTIPRKENYTKAVKSWLDDVENYLPNIDSVIKESNQTDDKVQPVKKVKTTIFKSKEKPKKKVIQSQLANKGGKMKFGKPQIAINENDDGNKLVDTTNKEVSAVSTDAKPDKEKVKEKKTKTKFVAPIKSQTPVKDIIYDVITLDQDNMEIYENILKEIATADVLVVLVYRNGFCQLNCNYTEDSCIPEGILINANDKFFYFKTFADLRIRQKIAEVLQANIICFEGKSILIFLTHLDININPALICDTKIGGALLHPDSPPESFSDLQKLVSHAAEYTIATDCVLQKASWYLMLLKETAARLRVLLVDNSLWTIFVDLEMRLLPIIADMERRGVSVDLEKLKSMEHVIVTKLKTVEQECHEAAGKPFQVNSTLQVRALIFDELKLDTKCNVKIRETLSKGAKSTSEATLRSLLTVHPLPKLILEYRHLHKAHATFLTGIAQYVKEGIVRPTWVQTAAATGRIASNNPNLQAIPKAPFSLIMFPDNEDIEIPVLNFRSVYTACEDHLLLAADFKHVECRVFAHAAGDEALLAALQSDEDLFRVLAAKWLKKSKAEVSDADRERTKRIVYASLYGAGVRKLMDILDASYEQTLAITTSFNRTFPSLKSFGRDVVARCTSGGGRLRSLCGRARTFKDIASQDFAARAHAERQAVNFIVQGSAADLCKMAMILTAEKLASSSPPVRARLVLQIHDELVWEVLEDDLHKAAAAVSSAMESCGSRCGLPLRLPVALAAGRSWGDLSPLPVTRQDVA